MNKGIYKLGLYMHYEGRVVWVYDIVDGVARAHKLIHFYYGTHSFSDEHIDGFISFPAEELNEIITHKNRLTEVWTFLGRIVPQGMFFQVV